jgi:drug/metabolite transporter (DMT)-like permease
MAIALGLLAAALYGAADFFGGFASRRSSMLAVAIVSQAAGFALLLVALPFFHGSLSRDALVFGAIGGACGGAGIALLYHALSIGKMGVVSPITAVIAAALPLAVGVMRGEHLAAWQSAGIAIALIAVVLISLTTEPDGRFEFSTIGVKEAVLSGLFLGGFYIFLARAGSSAGLYPLISARFASTFLLLVLALLARQSVVPNRATLPVVFLIGAIDVTANCLYVLATYAGYLSIAAVLTSLYPASTVFLARIVLGERLSLLQRIGVFCALAGVALIAL